MKIYLAGPMTGIDQFNFPKFMDKELELLEKGYEVFNPAAHEKETYRENLALDTEWICMNAEGMYMLKGWERSPGARAEWALGNALGLQFFYE